jgi:hypothetical protein
MSDGEDKQGPPSVVKGGIDDLMSRGAEPVAYLFVAG